MKTKSIFSALCGAAVIAMGFSSCGPEPTQFTLSLDKATASVGVGTNTTITATITPAVEGATVTFTSSNEAVATVVGTMQSCTVTGVSEGTAVITATYQGVSKTCAVQVSGSGSDTRLSGTDYMVFIMDETTFDGLGNKVKHDFRPNGEYDNDGNVTPEGADVLIQIWNPKAEIGNVECTGQNSFGVVEPWFATKSVAPTPDGGWGNICGGNNVSNLNGKWAAWQELNEDYSFCISFKGVYTAAAPLDIKLMAPDGTEVLVYKQTKKTGENEDGDWQIVEIPYAELGIDFSQPITNDAFFTVIFVGTGAGTQVDIDAAFFYKPLAQ